MSIPTTEPLFADSNSLSYAYKAGGSNLLDSYLAAAKAQGMSLTITDQVEREILGGPQRSEVGQWLTDNNIPGLR